MDGEKSKKRGKAHSEALRQALIRLIEINVPGRFASEREMAEVLDFSPAHFSQMKNGFRTIGKDSAEKIEKGLQLGVGGLYQYQGDAAASQMPPVAGDVALRYDSASQPVRMLVELALRTNAQKPEWVTKAIEHQLVALIESIAEKLEER